MKILSIDPATSSGIAILNNNCISVTNFKCSTESIPTIFSYFDINGFLEMDQILLEEWTHFNGIRNPKTTRDLLYRIGFIKYRFLELGFHLEMMNVNNVRSLLGIKGKKSIQKKTVNEQLREYTGEILTTDITDAIAQILAYVGHDSLESIKEYEFIKLKNMKI